MPLTLCAAQLLVLSAAVMPNAVQETSEPARVHAHGTAARMSWARLLKRVFDNDVEHDPNCGGRLEVIAHGRPN